MGYKDNSMFRINSGSSLTEQLLKENDMLSTEIRVVHEASEISNRLVIEQFEKAEALMCRFQSATGFLQAVMDAALQISIIASDLDGKIILFNRGAELMLGYSEKDAKKMSFFDIIDSKDLMENCLNILQDVDELVSNRDKHIEAINSITSNINEGIFCKRSGVKFPVSFAITPLRGEGGNVVGCLSVAMDISKLKEAETSLQKAYDDISEANERLKKLDKLKSDFLSSVSHELRTPLTSIRGFSRLISKDFDRFFRPKIDGDSKLMEKADKITENLNIILTETERLTRLINDVLDLSKIESQKTEWREEPINMAEMLRHAVNAAKGQFDEKPQITLITDIPEALPYIYGDYDRLVQVAVNLLNNASKFTREGTVSVRSYDRGDGYVQTDVTDTGCGFPQDEAEAIFDKFRQVCHGDTLQDKPTGTGLGLSICHEIISRFGGKIWAVSEVGKGSTFSFSLPVLRQETGLMAAEAGPDAKLILVVDDEMAIRSLLTQFFSSYGFRVATADNGRLALDMAKKYKPDLITMDIAMPVMDGKEAIAIMKNDEHLCNIPIIVLSAFNETFQTEGDIVFDKPINEQRLIDSVYMLINKEKLDTFHSCIIVCRDETECIVDVPSITPAKATICSIDSLMQQLDAGYKGLVVIPSDIMELIDLHTISGNENIQLLILPGKH